MAGVAYRGGAIVAALLAVAGCGSDAGGASSSTSSSVASSSSSSATPSATVTSSSTTSSSTSSSASQATVAAERYYPCLTLLTDAELQQATGLSGLTLITTGDQSKEIGGHTYCQWGGNIVVNVFTGSSYQTIFTPLAAAGAGLPDVPGLGDTAKWSATPPAKLGVRVKGLGLLIVINDPSGIPDPKQAAVAMARIVIARL